MTRLGNVRDFELLKFLGKGTFGAVYQARRAEDKKIYAIKKVDTRRMSTKERTESVNEIRVLASISGPHVITFFEAFVDADILYIVRHLLRVRVALTVYRQPLTSCATCLGLRWP